MKIKMKEGCQIEGGWLGEMQLGVERPFDNKSKARVLLSIADSDGTLQTIWLTRKQVKKLVIKLISLVEED